jgi:hypothetical protein
LARALSFGNSNCCSLLSGLALNTNLTPRQVNCDEFMPKVSVSRHRAAAARLRIVGCALTTTTLNRLFRAIISLPIGSLAVKLGTAADNRPDWPNQLRRVMSVMLVSPLAL